MKYRFAFRKIRSKQCIWWICAPSSGYLTAADYQVIGSQVESTVAAKLARLVYRMLRHGMKYVDLGAALYEAQHRQVQIKHLKWKAAKLGYQIVQAPAA